MIRKFIDEHQMDSLHNFHSTGSATKAEEEKIMKIKLPKNLSFLVMLYWILDKEVIGAIPLMTEFN